MSSIPPPPPIGGGSDEPEKDAYTPPPPPPIADTPPPEPEAVPISEVTNSPYRNTSGPAPNLSQSGSTPPAAPPKKTNPTTVSLILGVLGICGITAIIGLIFGIIGFREATKENRSRALPIVALVLNSFWIVLLFIALVSGSE